MASRYLMPGEKILAPRVCCGMDWMSNVSMRIELLAREVWTGSVCQQRSLFREAGSSGRRMETLYRARCSEHSSRVECASSEYRKDGSLRDQEGVSLISSLAEVDQLSTSNQSRKSAVSVPPEVRCHLTAHHWIRGVALFAQRVSIDLSYQAGDPSHSFRPTVTPRVPEIARRVPTGVSHRLHLIVSLPNLVYAI